MEAIGITTRPLLRIGCFWGGIALLLASLGAAGFDPATDTRPEKVQNPHWNAQRCGSCHAMKDGKAQKLAYEDVDHLCLGCHDGQRARGEVHSIGRVLNTKLYHAPEGWPLLQGRVGCLTCHDIKQGCDEAAGQPAANTKFLRGAPEGAADKSFCQSCHKAEHFTRFNPHMMIDDKKEAIQDKCLFCHDRLLDRNAMQRTGQPHLRSKEVLMCRTCHPTHKDQFTPGHMGSLLSADKLAYIRAREVVGLTSTPGKDMLEQLKKQQAKPVYMVPGEDSRITCSTCHNPHQQGLFPGSSNMGYRAMRVVKDRTVSPVRGEKWCNHCHDL